MPSYQGELDGLCGPYAIANALGECGYQDSERIFRLACEALGQSRWPQVLWEGTSFRDMQTMIKACLMSFDFIQANYPFMHNVPESNTEYWNKFNDLFEDRSRICAIVGLKKPSAHWIVMSSDGARISFTDSNAEKPYLRKNRSSLVAGLRRKSPNQWLIEMKELIVFSKK